MAFFAICIHSVNLDGFVSHSVVYCVDLGGIIFYCFLAWTDNKEGADAAARAGEMSQHNGRVP